MTPSPEPLRQLPFTPRPFRRETIGSFLTRLACANRIRIWHLLQLTAINVQEQREFTPATDDWLGWSPSTPHRIAALTGRPLAALSAAFPAIAGSQAQPACPPAPQAGKIQRACRHCTAAQNITSMVIVQARPHDYLCVRHDLWHHGIRDIDLRPLPQVTDAQRRHNHHVRTLPAAHVANAHQQAHSIIDEWITWSWHPALTSQWQYRLRIIGAADARHPSPWLNAVTHPELLSVASMLLSARHRDINAEREMQSRLGFPYQAYPGEPLTLSLAQLQKRQSLPGIRSRRFPANMSSPQVTASRMAIFTENRQPGGQRPRQGFCAASGRREWKRSRVSSPRARWKTAG
jgi:TniQ